MNADATPENKNAGNATLNPSPLLPPEEEIKEIYFASQWKLIWWKFRKHRLATIAGPMGPRPAGIIG